jgi:hypothetical protein
MVRTPADLDDARREIQAIIGSGIFAPSSRLAMLLEYLFNMLMAGRVGDLKESTLAVELFHKPVSFDSHSDATVRVEAHRLRKKLEKYYETYGRDSELRVVLPVGQYVLEFRRAPIKESAVGAPPEPQITPPIAAPPRPKRKGLYWGAAVAAVLFGFVGLHYARLPHQPTKNEAKMVAPKSEGSMTLDPEPDAVRILVGHTGEPYVDNVGRRWQSDRFFEGGVVRKVNHEVSFRTSHPELFQSVREGASRYRIPLPRGEYEMQVYLTYPDILGVDLGPERRFRITIIRVNGQNVSILDLASEVGYNAAVRSFAHLRPDHDGILDVEFVSARGPAAVCAIEILPMIHGQVNPVRIVMQPHPFLDIRGRFWYPDDYYAGGNFGDFPAAVNGGVDPGIVSLDRSGDFEYFIPVPEGEYQVTLYFGEAYHGPGLVGGGGIGSRVFDVLLNNEMVLRDFDILRQAPPLRLVTRTFRHVRPEKKQGNIHLTFSSKVHLACVRAIEVVPEE